LELNTMADIYDQHDKAFSKVSAFVILDDKGERVATVAIKFPSDGAGRLWAYAHFIGVPMTRLHAEGFGYDKRTPAVCGAFLKATARDEHHDPALLGKLERFKAELHPHSGYDWSNQLEKAGYRVLQAV
jgi:hypothetical protein